MSLVVFELVSNKGWTLTALGPAGNVRVVQATALDQTLVYYALIFSTSVHTYRSKYTYQFCLWVKIEEKGRIELIFPTMFHTPIQSTNVSFICSPL